MHQDLEGFAAAYGFQNSMESPQPASLFKYPVLQVSTLSCTSNLI